MEIQVSRVRSPCVYAVMGSHEMLGKLARLFMHNIDRVTKRLPVILRVKHSSPSFLEDENRKSRALLAEDVGSRDKLTTGLCSP